MLKNIIGPIFEIVCMPLRKEILMEKIKRNAALFDCLLAWQQCTIRYKLVVSCSYYGTVVYIWHTVSSLLSFILKQKRY